MVRGLPKGLCGVVFRHDGVAGRAALGRAVWRFCRARRLTTTGRRVRLIPPQHVKPPVKRGKTDRADAEAVCEAVSRPSMRFVPVKTAGRQGAPWCCARGSCWCASARRL